MKRFARPIWARKQRMLELTGIDAFYGQSQALFGMSLSVRAGQVVSLMGRNGMGKTTTIRAIMGLIQPLGGSLQFQQRNLVGPGAGGAANLPKSDGAGKSGRHCPPG
jgi:branched-chain amino acid transport system ATP-binding protein